ncbi:hypothetical protein GCM10025857_13390 [Alicyclobacillus contaminans]|nr:hypothetical protein GCM10025857_13390 [Alicyclobacillus contaminans]
MPASRRKLLFFTFLYKAVNSLILFVSSAIVAHGLNRPDRGEFQLAGSYQQTGNTIFGGFMNYYAFALRKRPQETVAVVQAGNFLVYTVSALTWLAAALLFVVPLPVAHISRIWFFALLAMGFTFIYGYGSRILNAMDEQSWLNRMNLAQPLLFLLLYIPLWLDRHLSEAAKLSWTYNLWIVSFAVAVGLTMIITYRHLRHAGILRWRVSLRELAGTLNYGGWSAAAQGTSNIARNVGYWCLASNKDILSVYGIALVMAEVLNNLSGSIIQLVFARMTGDPGRTPSP